jgi:putative ABC transport system ATP-binding protein
MLRVNAVSKSYAGPRRRSVLKDIDLALSPGEYVAIMGESGVGKSTLLNLIAGLDQPDGGDIELDGKRLVDLSDAALTRVRREKMGFVFQAYHVLPYLSVLQNVALPLQLIGVSAREVEPRVRGMLDAVGLGPHATAMPAELSGGELQRVAIARALVHHPRLLLADEPTGNLDPDTADQVLALLRAQVKAGGAAGILVTHSPHAAQTADRVLLLSAAGLREIDAYAAGRRSLSS